MRRWLGEVDRRILPVAAVEGDVDHVVDRAEGPQRADENGHRHRDAQNAAAVRHGQCGRCRVTMTPDCRTSADEVETPRSILR